MNNLTSLNNGIPDIKRICSLCGTDRTPLAGGLNLVNDRRGDGLELFGECCYTAVMTAVDESPRAYRSYGNVTTKEIHSRLLTRAKEIANNP